MFNWSNLTNLIFPAIILSAVPFFIKFFGKAVADQAPFADDRNWVVELGGLMFFNTYVLSPLVGTYILVAYKFNPFQFTGNDWFLISSAVVVSVGLFCVRKKSRRFFSENDFKTKPLTQVVQIFSLHLISYALLILAYFYYLWGAYIYIIPLAIYFLMHLLGFALFSSLHSGNILISDIYFTDKEREPIRNCRIIKINNDSVRFIAGNRVHLLSKTQVFEIVKKRNLPPLKKKK
jgi:hypothetical protein